MNEGLPAPGGAEEAAPPETDEAVVRRVQAGDAAAFELLMDRYKTRLYTVIRNIVNNPADAADLLQETFVKAFKSIAGFRSKSNFYTWLYRIGVNTSLNFLKKHREAAAVSLEAAFLEGGDEPEFVELVAREDVAREAGREELQKRLNEALEKLSNLHRTVVVLHDIEGMKHQDVAKVLGCTEATARSRLFYAHQQLQAWLAKYL